MKVTITGGAGYIGSTLAEQLLAAGHDVRVLDRLLFGQQAVVDALEAMGAEVLVGDVRESADRAAAVADADALVHLAAIVGDPACARDPDGSAETNVDASLAMVDDAQAAGVARIIFASTCSNYGRSADPTVALDETAQLAPVSLYATQKVQIEKALLSGTEPATCLRFATVYGAGRRAICGRVASSRSSASSSGAPTFTSPTRRAASRSSSPSPPRPSSAASSTSATATRTTRRSTWSR